MRIPIRTPEIAVRKPRHPFSLSNPPAPSPRGTRSEPARLCHSRQTVSFGLAGGHPASLNFKLKKASAPPGRAAPRLWRNETGKRGEVIFGYEKAISY